MRSTTQHTTGRAISALLSVAIVSLVTTITIGAGPAGATSCARPGPDQLPDLAAVEILYGAIETDELTGVAAGGGSEPAATTTITLPASTTSVPVATPSSGDTAGWVGPATRIAGLTLLGAVRVTLARRHKGS